MGMFDQVSPQAALSAFYERVLHGLSCILGAANDSATAATGAARSLAYQFGEPPMPGADARLRPRAMVALPVVFEDTVTEATTCDVLERAHRYACAGFYANLGADPFRVVLVGHDGQQTAPHTLPPGATVQLSGFVSKVVVQPVDGAPAFFQVYAL